MQKIRINKKYKPLWVANYRCAIISGGRGSAKSFSGQTFIRDLSYEAGHKALITRYTMKSAKKSIIPEFTGKFSLSQSPYSDNLMFNDFSLIENTYTNIYSKSEIIFTGIKTSSGIQTASLKSIEGITTWLMEEAEELIDDGSDVEATTFDKIDDSIRKKGIQLRTILIWNPSTEDSFIYQRFFKARNLPITFNGMYGDTLYIYTSYLDNLENLNESFVKKAEEVKQVNLPRYNHIYLGYPVTEKEGALWKRKTMIDPYRVNIIPDLKRIVVAVDPSVTSTGNQDECGIVVAGLGFDDHFYLLGDESGLYSAYEWSKLVAAAYKNYDADRIVAEVNQGGDLVEMAIRNIDKNLPVKKIRASKGKLLRAEPVAALYEQGRVHHVGHFVKLENEMVFYDGNGESPNRLDAAVYSILELSQNKIVTPRAIEL